MRNTILVLTPDLKGSLLLFTDEPESLKADRTKYTLGKSSNRSPRNFNSFAKLSNI